MLPEVLRRLPVDLEVFFAVQEVVIDTGGMWPVHGDPLGHGGFFAFGHR